MLSGRGCAIGTVQMLQMSSRSSEAKKLEEVEGERPHFVGLVVAEDVCGVTTAILELPNLHWDCGLDM